jgi:leucine-rich repeat kinase 2
LKIFSNKFLSHTTKTANFKETQIIYEFEYLPAGLFNRAQVRLFQMTSNKCIWKNGSLLIKNNHLALITRNLDKLIVRAQGQQPENLIFLIHEVIEQLICESFNGVTYDLYFPCPDCYTECCIDNENSMYSASLVRRATNKKAVFLQCRASFHIIPVIDLLARMPPDTNDNYDIHMRNSVRELKHLKQQFTYDIIVIYSILDTQNEGIKTS